MRTWTRLILALASGRDAVTERADLAGTMTETKPMRGGWRLASVPRQSLTERVLQRRDGVPAVGYLRGSNDDGGGGTSGVSSVDATAYQAAVAGCGREAA
jgi:hypothetical protein